MSFGRSQIAPAGFAIQRPGGGLQIRREQKCDLLSLDEEVGGLSYPARLLKLRAYSTGACSLDRTVRKIFARVKGGMEWVIFSADSGRVY